MKMPFFIPLADPIQESEVNLNLRWSADKRTARAIERQAKLMGAILGEGSIPFTHCAGSYKKPGLPVKSITKTSLWFI